MDLRDANMNRKDNVEVDTTSRLNAILAEYNTLREEMRMFLQFHRRDTYLVAIVVGGVAVFTGRNEMMVTECIYNIIPSVIFVYFMCQLMNLHHVSAQAKACKRIEKRVNNLFGEDIMIDWEMNVAPKYVRSLCWPVMLSVIGLMVFLILMFLFFEYKALKLCGLNLLTGFHILEFVYILIVLYRWFIFEYCVDKKSL